MVSDTKCLIQWGRGELGSCIPEAVVLGLYGFGQIRRLELSSFALALWSSGWLSWWKILIFIRRNMWCSIDCLILIPWTLWYNLNKVMFEGVQESVFEMLMLMLSEALFCRYTQAYDKQHVDQSNCRRVPRWVCLVVKGWHVLLTVERHRQRSCKWGCFAYKYWAGRIIFFCLLQFCHMQTSGSVLYEKH